MTKEIGEYAPISEIIPEQRLNEFKEAAEIMANKVSGFKDSWVCKYPFIADLVLWYYEKKFLRLIKRLKNGR